MSATASPPPAHRGASANPEEDLFEGGRAKYACEQCKRRKLKCTRDVPACTFCSEHHHECIYTKTLRTPLTRKNLDAAEKRIAELEERLNREKSHPPPSSFLTSSSPFSSTAAARPPLIPMHTSFSTASTSSALPAAMELGPPAPETTTEPEGDGMGALSLEQNGGSGAYLGSLSGAALLTFLQRCASDVNLSAHGSAGKAAPSPSSTITSTTQILPEQMTLFVNSYFSCYHLQYPLVHEASFRAQLADIVPRPGGAVWNLLYQVILGLGSMCVVGPEGLEGGEAVALYERAIASVKPHLFEATSLTAVQLNHTASGSVYIGIALRMAINIGLHCESGARNLSVFEQEQRRRVWWTLFCFEAGASMTFSHPSTLPTAGVDVLPLANVHDSYFTPAAVSRPAANVDAATPYSSLLHQVYFAQFAISVVTYLTTSQHTITPADTQRIYRDLDLFQASLSPYVFREQPPWFDFARAKLCWRLDNLRMVILRQTFLKVSLGQSESPEEEQIFERCIACAGEVIRSVQRFTESAPRSAMEWWYSLHFLFPAAFVPLIALRVRPASPLAVDWVVVVQSAKGVLERVQHALLKPLASRCLAIISAVANLEGRGSTEVSSVQLDADFSSFLEKLAGPPEFSEGMPSLALQAPWQAPGVMTDLDALFQWFTPAGSPQPVL
ncbi:hypothetical protein JCM10450v2_008239 [Rhodotorula kratochvilovae]